MNVDVEAAIKAIRRVPYNLAEAQEISLRPFGSSDDEGDFVPPGGSVPSL